MNRPETERLRTRIQQLRYALAPAEGQAADRLRAEDMGERELINDLRTRVAHLEQLLQGLQDSVYRESQRVDKQLAELEMRTDPAALATALSENARNRGL
jgi:predicted  nucleic acid-binding Zn-ribbon protein